MCIKKLLLLFSVVFCNLAKSQQTNQQLLDSFSGKFIATIRTHENQRAYLVTDKSIFAGGEIIWFKAFLLNSVSQRISTKSSFLFVDLVNEKDSVLKLLVLDAGDQQLDSRIVLPESLPQGYYWLRAYTKQMTEADTSGICIKPIYVIDKNNSIGATLHTVNTSNNSSSPLINFYPEGGSIITGANSTVVIKATDKSGVPIATSIVIKDSRDTAVAEVATKSYGLAKFSFEPSGYRKYKAVINWLGKEITYPLPPFNFYAGQLAVTKQPGGYKLRVLLEDSLYTKNVLTYVVGISKDSLIFTGIGSGLYEVMVTNDKIPDGITTFYLFDKNFNLLSERGVYAHGNNLRISVATDKNMYAKRDKVTLSISTTDAAQRFIPSLVSISVIDTLAATANGQCTFRSMAYDEQFVDNMLLAQNEYLTDDEIDLLMLLRDNSYQTLNKKITKNNIADNDSLLYIQGTAFTEKKNEPATNKILTLISNLSSPDLYSDTTDQQGHFSFPLKKYGDSTQFAVQVQNLNGIAGKANIVMDMLKYPRLSTPVSLKQYLALQSNVAKRYINTYYADEQINWNTQSQLTPVKVKYTKKVNYDISKRISSNSTIITPNELDGRTSISMLLLGAVGKHVSGSPTSFDGFSEPLLIVDGAVVNPPLGSEGVGSFNSIGEFLDGINPQDVDFIEILRRGDAANFGVRGGNGVILVNTLTKRRDINFNRGNVSLTKFYAKGITSPVLFPITDYQPKDKKIPEVPDTRSTLFWNGSYLSDNAHNATITFYTSDIPATYRVTVTGVTIDGDIIYKTILFQSK